MAVDSCLLNADIETVHKTEFYKLKRKIQNHVYGISASGFAHLDAIAQQQDESNRKQIQLKATLNIVAAALTCLKMKSAKIHYETLLAQLYFCQVDIGTMGHSV